MASFENEIRRAEQRDRDIQLYPIERSFDSFNRALCCAFGFDTLPVCKAEDRTKQSVREDFVKNLSHTTQFTPEAINGAIDEMEQYSDDPEGIHRFIGQALGLQPMVDDGRSESERRRAMFVDPRTDIKRDAFIFTPRLGETTTYDAFNRIHFKQPSKFPSNFDYAPNKYTMQFMRQGMTGSSLDPSHNMWTIVQRPAAFGDLGQTDPKDAEYITKKRLYSSVLPFVGSRYSGLSERSRVNMVPVSGGVLRAMRYAGLPYDEKRIMALAKKDVIDSYDRIVPQIGDIGRAVDAHYQRMGWNGTTPIIMYDPSQLAGIDGTLGKVSNDMFAVTGRNAGRPTLFMSRKVYDPITFPFYGVTPVEKGPYTHGGAIQTIDLDGMIPTWVHEMQHILQQMDISRAIEAGERVGSTNSYENGWVADVNDPDIRSSDDLKRYLSGRADQWRIPGYDGWLAYNLERVQNGTYNNGHGPVRENISMATELDWTNAAKRALAEANASLRRHYGMDSDPNMMYFASRDRMMPEGLKYGSGQILMSGPELYRRLYGDKTKFMDDLKKVILDRVESGKR